jgi:hypothetical protein
MYQDKIITAEEVRSRAQDGFKFSKIYHLATERILDAVNSEADIIDIAWNQRGISFCTKKGEQWDCSHSIGKQITKEEFDEVIAEVKKGWKDLLQPYEGELNSYKLLLHKL